jgi:hypothetical protein
LHNWSASNNVDHRISNAHDTPLHIELLSLERHIPTC